MTMTVPYDPARPMAILRHLQSSHTHRLLSEYLIGRGDTCHLRLDSRLVSSTHAQLRWTGSGWEIHDLDSRNGTFVEGRRLDPGERLPITAGMTLAFGDLDDRFALEDDSPPVAHAVNTHGERRQAQATHMLVLPDADHPVYTVFQDNGRWLVETSSSGERRPVASGDVLSIDADTPDSPDRWTLSLPAIVEPTWRREEVQPLLREVALRFTVSRDQEHIALCLSHAGGSISLSPRVHMELLLRLAEVRIEDQKQAGMSAAEEGWVYVSEVLNKLGIPDDAGGRNLLCQHICQARKQIAGAGVVGAMEIVQRRTTIATEVARRAGQIRIGVHQLDIEHP